MPEFLEIKCLTKKDQEKIINEIEKRIKLKLKDGVFTEREIKEIEQMKLRPLPDIQDVQSVYEKLEFEKKS
jgi:hypothetical protein